METINKRAIMALKQILKDSAIRNRMDKITWKLSISSNPAKVENLTKQLANISSKYIVNKLKKEDFWQDYTTAIHILYNQLRETNRPHLGSLEKEQKYIKDNKWIFDDITKILEKKYPYVEEVVVQHA